eukprot:Phypoly_transcript_07583.p1 GENE.Phypoly_transcript_07583~~Phypoly_transcript_07583.p1  ORF type:complete len:332 (+),score=70.54 Phypoly_transcript_07583:588-1583(+)
MEAALEELQLEEEIRQLELKQIKAAKEAGLKAECEELQERLELEKRQIDELRAVMKELKERERIKSDIERLKFAAEAYDLDVEPPNWTDDRSWRVYEAATIEYYTVTSITSGSELKKIKEEKGEMRMKEKPFGKGTFRLAYYAQLKVGTSVKNMIAKAFILPTKLGDDSDLLANIETQLIAKNAAEQFCKANKSTSIEFADALLVRTAKYNFFVESHLSGVWKRFTNNTGGVSELEKAPTAIAFSHFSYQVSKEYMVVVDIQGIRTPSGYLLTDPAVHCKASKYGDSNFGAEGFDKFFETHECNAICNKLGLKRHPKQVKLDNLSPIPANT